MKKNFISNWFEIIEQKMISSYDIINKHLR